MNGTLEEAVELATSLRDALQPLDGAEVAVCPGFVSLKPVQDVLRGSCIRVGAQDVFYEDNGAYTGAVSAPMLADLCDYCIVGHSERRQWFGESDDWVGRKVAALRRHGIVPILCVGETLEERDANMTASVIERQMLAVLRSVIPCKQLVVAYEPVWAIGTGRSADPASVNHTVHGIRSIVSSEWGNAYADEIRILYGGSVTADNVTSFVSQSEIDGTLVGGASLKCAEFCDIVARSAAVRG